MGYEERRAWQKVREMVDGWSKEDWEDYTFWSDPRHRPHRPSRERRKKESDEDDGFLGLLMFVICAYLLYLLGKFVVAHWLISLIVGGSLVALVVIILIASGFFSSPTCGGVEDD